MVKKYPQIRVNPMRNQKIVSFTAVLVVLLFCFFRAPLWAVVLDSTFGEEGVVTTSLDHFGDEAKAVTLDTNNRILVAGVSANGLNFDFSLARYNEDGSLDTTFSDNGVVTTQIGSGDDQAQAIALQEDGKIVVAGYAFNGQDSDFALARYMTDGRLDLEFGLGGIVVLPIGNGNDMAHAVAVQADGSILIAGSASGTSGRVAALARIRDNGSLDPSFGYDGVVFSGSGRDTIAHDLLIQEDGAIVVTGQYTDREGETLLLMRYLANGRPDLDFGLAGVADTALVYPAETAGTSITLQENGAILIAGSSGSGKDQDIALFRYLPHGQYDPSFGDRGMVSRDLNNEADGAYDIVATPAGIFVGGYTTMNGLRDFVLLKYSYTGVSVEQDSDTAQKAVSRLPGGEPGTAKSSVGSEANTHEVSVTTTSISSFDDTGYGLAVQKDTNKIILVGASGDEGLTAYALARYTSEDSVTAVPKSVEATSPYVVTTEVTEITRNSALTGGTILPGSGLTFTSRGVVYSSAPYPVLSSGATDDTDPTDPPIDPGDWDDVGPVQSNWSPTGKLSAGTTETTLTVNTNVPAECRYDNYKVGLTFETMTKTMTSSGGASPYHTALLTGLTNGGSNTTAYANYLYTIRCRDTATGVTNLKNHNVPFAVGVATSLSKAFTGTVESQLKSSVTDPVDAAPAVPAETAIPKAAESVVAEKVEGGKVEAGAGEGKFSVMLTELSVGTRYYVRAYGVTSKGVIYYGNELSFETKDACFIATAAYGSLAHPDVETLRTFRDLYLKPFSWGRAFIDTYYRYSPALAQVIEHHPLLRPAVRLLLLPVIGVSSILIHFSEYWIAFVTGLSGLFLIVGFGWQRLRARKEAFS